MDGLVGKLLKYAVMLLAAAVAFSMQLHFEPCSRRGNRTNRYVGVTPGYTLFLSDTEITMRFGGPGSLSMKASAGCVERRYRGD